jgi:hypothetical protein
MNDDDRVSKKIKTDDPRDLFVVGDPSDGDAPSPDDDDGMGVTPDEEEPAAMTDEEPTSNDAEDASSTDSSGSSFKESREREGRAWETVPDTRITGKTLVARTIWPTAMQLLTSTKRRYIPVNIIQRRFVSLTVRDHHPVRGVLAFFQFTQLGDQVTMDTPTLDTATCFFQRSLGVTSREQFITFDNQKPLMTKLDGVEWVACSSNAVYLSSQIQDFSVELEWTPTSDPEAKFYVRTSLTSTVGIFRGGNAVFR